jgi:hypothetical protein
MVEAPDQWNRMHRLVADNHQSNINVPKRESSSCHGNGKSAAWLWVLSTNVIDSQKPQL